MIQAGYVRSSEPRARQQPSAGLVVPLHEPEVIARSGGRYGEDRAPSWSAIAVILGVHLLLFAVLGYFDVVHLVRKPAPRLTVIEIRPEPIVPPPAPPESKTPDPPVERPIVTPPAIVQLVQPAPPIATVPVAPPPPPAAAPPATAPVSEAAPPVSPPDGSAKTLGNPAPKYPLEARRNHWQGVVRLRVVITAEGGVKDIAVARSSGFDSLDEAALKTVAKWRFLPGKQAGMPVEAVGFLSIPFHLT